MLAIKKAVSTLRDEEVKQYLTGILAGIGELKEQHGQLERPLDKHMAEPVAELIEQYSSLMSLPAQRAFWDPAPDSTHVHILCGDSFGGSVKQVLKEFGWTDTHKLIILRENYAIGPLDQLDTPVGRKLRSDWFRQHIHEYFTVSDECEREYSELLDNLEQIPEQAKIVIWTGSNASEQAGLRLAVHLLGNRQNEIIVLDAGAICEQLFNRPNVFINYCHSGEIPSDKLREALLWINDGSRLSAADIARLSQDWLTISGQSGVLRIWQEDALLEVPSDYYDSYLLEKLDSLQPPPGDDGFLKSARLVGEAIGYCEQYVGDAYFEHRVRELIYSGVLEIKGVPTAMRFYSIRYVTGFSAL